MTSKVFQLMNDPRDPEVILSSLSAQELSSLTDALYRNLDTPSPVPGTETWYELAIEEGIRRTTAAPAAGPQENAATPTQSAQELPVTTSAGTRDLSG
jgi:hypothetical protein